MSRPHLKILLAAPRGFCAGVDRAIKIVELALEKYGPPVYVRHEIVHNKYVVQSLVLKGAVFVEELDEIPDDGQPVIFSAHGVPKSVPEEANSRKLFYIDATCPLVSKVHREAERHYKNGKQVLLIGHNGHPEVYGTMGQLPDGAVKLIETVDDIPSLVVLDEANLAWCSQTTLSVEDTAQIVSLLKRRFPSIVGPLKEDICYATTNRQAAVKAIATKTEALIVIGAPNSSNSNRLVEMAISQGCQRSWLVERACDINWKDVNNVKVLGLTAGASAPEILIDEVVEAARSYFQVTVEEISIIEEHVKFKVPKILAA